MRKWIRSSFLEVVVPLSYIDTSSNTNDQGDPDEYLQCDGYLALRDVVAAPPCLSALSTRRTCLPDDNAKIRSTSRSLHSHQDTHPLYQQT